jgi:putative copper export protein
MIAYDVVVWLHIVAAATWIGGMLFFALIVVPSVRRSPGATALLQAMGRRLRLLGWVLLAVLLMTGTVNLRFHGIGWSALRQSGFWATGFGRALAFKLWLVAALTAATLVHDGLTRRGPDSRRMMAVWSGRLILLLSLGVVFFAVALVRGGL